MRASSSWTWLFPLTYAIHVSEELFGGEHFYVWISRVAGANLSREDFLTINSVAMPVMCLAVLLINYANARWLIAMLGTMVALNGTLHTVSSIVTQSYSPGTVSGLLVWLPLGVYALRRGRRELTQAQFSLGIAAGLALHAMVMLIALTA